MRHVRGSESLVQHLTAGPDRRLDFCGSGVTMVVSVGSLGLQPLRPHLCRTARHGGSDGEGVAGADGQDCVSVVGVNTKIRVMACGFLVGIVLSSPCHRLHFLLPQPSPGFAHLISPVPLTTFTYLEHQAKSAKNVRNWT